MSNEEVLVTPINSVEVNGSGQVEAISNIISAGLLGTGNAQNEENTPTDNSNLITTPKKKSSKHSHRKKLTVAERLARCAITENKQILDVPPDEKHSKIGKRSRRVRTYGSYEEYCAAKLRNHDSLNPDESDIVSKSEFYMSDDDTEGFEEIQKNESRILDSLIFEENDSKRRDFQEEHFEELSHPHILCDIAPNRNVCYDDVSAAIDRGMPGNPLEKEIEEQEAREQKEHEDDLQNFALMHYPESSLATQLGLNFNSDYIRNDFGAASALNDQAFNESAFSVSEINSDLISMSPRSPRGINRKMRNVCPTGTFTLLSVQPDEEKVEEYQEKKHYTHARRYRTTDKTNEFNESLGSQSGSISNVKLESKSTLAIFTDSEENTKTEEGISLSQALVEEKDVEEDKLNKSEHKELQNALNEEKNSLVIEGRGLSCSGSNLSSDFYDLTIYSDAENIKTIEDEYLKEEIEEEKQTIKDQKALKEQQKLLRQQEAEQRRLDLLKRIEQPDIPPNDITPNGDGTTDVGIQTVRCDIEDLVNRRPSKRTYRARPPELSSVYYDLYAIQPRVLLNIEADRNACYDNYNDAIDRGMPGNPLEDEIEELEALEAKERQDDVDYYNTQLYNERALKDELQHSINSDVLRDEFGNRPPRVEPDQDEIIEEEEADYASQSDPEPIVPPTDEFTTSPRLRRRVRKPVLKTFEVQCELIHATPLEEIRPPPVP